jgi:hypothetical protein
MEQQRQWLSAFGQGRLGKRLRRGTGSDLLSRPLPGPLSASPDSCTASRRKGSADARSGQVVAGWMAVAEGGNCPRQEGRALP